MTDEEIKNTIIRRKPDDERCDAVFRFRLPEREKSEFLRLCREMNVNHVQQIRYWMKRFVEKNSSTDGQE